LLANRVKDGQRQWQSSDAKHVVYEKRSEIAVASSATRTGEVVGRAAAADEVVRRLGRPELLPELAPATLIEEEKPELDQLTARFCRETMKRGIGYPLTGTVKSTVRTRFLRSSAGLFNCSARQKGGRENNKRESAFRQEPSEKSGGHERTDGTTPVVAKSRLLLR
jgi:hypothetical protein